MRSKRKRILKEDPNTMLGNLFEEEDGEEANIFVAEAIEAEAKVATEEIQELEDTMSALIDSGSEVNLMSREVYEEGGWMIDKDIDWKVNSVNSTRNPLYGACPDVKVKFGNVVEPQNIFVKESLPYPVILGQPFIIELRMETKVLDDGTHMAKIRSRDGLRVVQFPTVLPNNGRNRMDLRSESDRKEWSSENGSVFR
ncbi:unnamed protein product [Calypogeia fissa]